MIALMDGKNTEPIVAVEYSLILSLCRRLIRPRRWLDPEDLATDVWIECEEKRIEDVRLVRVIVRSRANDKLRRYRLEQSTNRHRLDGPLDDDSRSLCVDHLRRLLDSVHLSEREHTLLYLRYWAGLTLTEIAKELGVSEVTVSSEHKSVLMRLKGASYANNK